MRIQRIITKIDDRSRKRLCIFCKCVRLYRARCNGLGVIATIIATIIGHAIKRGYLILTLIKITWYQATIITVIQIIARAEVTEIISHSVTLIATHQMADTLVQKRTCGNTSGGGGDRA